MQRVLGRFGNQHAGPRVIVTGGIHGNEPSGLDAIARVMRRIADDRPRMDGSVVFLAGNLAAIEQGVRYVDLDLNRQWTAEGISASFDEDEHPNRPVEHRELRELARELERLIETAPGRLYFVDLHTSSAAGVPFLTVGDTLRNRRFAERIPLSMILGLEEQVDGALLELLNNLGCITMGVEAGLHDSPESAQVHEAVLWMALTASGVMPPEAVPELDRHRRYLETARQGLPRVIEVRARHALSAGDGFRMEPGYLNFQPVNRGEVVAHDNDGPVRVPEDGMILLPLYQGKGDDGFFVAREVHPIWLRISAVLRRMRARGILRFLPGIRRDPDRPGVIVVDTRIARWYPLEVLHLFGYRKLRRTGTKLVVGRRRFDFLTPPRVRFALPSPPASETH
jgi:succinylglutamate desuccinylase